MMTPEELYEKDYYAYHSYGSLFAPELKEELAKVLHEKVVEDVRIDYGITLSKIVENNIDAHIKEFDDGFPDNMLVEAMDESYGSKFCKECEVPRCCTQSDPIEVNWFDIKKLAKHYGMTNKAYIKKCLRRHKSTHETSSAGYSFKQTLPCAFLEEGRCVIYDVRPIACKVFPITQEMREGVPLFDLQVMEWCNYPFNLLRYSLVIKAIFEQMTLDQPEQAQRLIEEAKKHIPKKEELEGLSQYSRLMKLRMAQNKLVEELKK
jgi:Fe-S-cluster containining protein